VHTGEVENALLVLPSIKNAIVFSVEDEEEQERVAAVLQTSKDGNFDTPDLLQLRRDLTMTTGLMEFKQPTLLRWLDEDETIPLTANGKISKVDLRRNYFGGDWIIDSKIEILDTRAMQYWRMGGQV
jgi:non-ribosomal peptide synthetase component E (peptide arylation enzyme)